VHHTTVNAVHGTTHLKPLSWAVVGIQTQSSLKGFIARKYKIRLEAAQMKFLRHLLGITKLDKEKKDTSIRRKTGAQSIVKEIEQYQQKWLQHVQRMDKNRLPRQALHYRPNGQRNIGRPRKRWADQLHLED